MSLPNEGPVILESVLVKIFKDIIDDEVEDFENTSTLLLCIYFSTMYIYFYSCEIFTLNKHFYAFFQTVACKHIHVYIHLHRV